MIWIRIWTPLLWCVSSLSAHWYWLPCEYLSSGGRSSRLQSARHDGWRRRCTIFIPVHLCKWVRGCSRKRCDGCKDSTSVILANSHSCKWIVSCNIMHCTCVCLHLLIISLRNYKLSFAGSSDSWAKSGMVKELILPTIITFCNLFEGKSDGTFTLPSIIFGRVQDKKVSVVKSKTNDQSFDVSTLFLQDPTVTTPIQEWLLNTPYIDECCYLTLMV